MRRADRTREALLDLDGQTVVLDEEGHVARFSVKQVSPSGRFVAQPRVYDHVHRGAHDAGRPYEFNGAGRLLEDFWIAVDRMLTLREE